MLKYAEYRSRPTAGNVVTYGHYEQDNDTANGKEPIEWVVLDVQGDKALLISKYGLDVRPYNTEYNHVTWEECTLRTWLNDTFLNAAFTPEGQQGFLLPGSVFRGRGGGRRGLRK